MYVKVKMPFNVNDLLATAIAQSSNVVYNNAWNNELRILLETFVNPLTTKPLKYDGKVFTGYIYAHDERCTIKSGANIEDERCVQDYIPHNTDAEMTMTILAESQGRGYLLSRQHDLTPWHESIFRLQFNVLNGIALSTTDNFGDIYI